MVWREVLVTWRCVALFRVEDGLGEPKANRSYLFYSSIIELIITQILDLLFVEKTNTSIRINITLKIISHYRIVLDLFYLENQDYSIRSMFYIKKLFPIEYEFLRIV